MNKQIIIKALESSPARSAWTRGVKDLAIDLVDGLEDGAPITREKMLNGAQDWSQYSYGGCGFIYDADIAEALCSPSELRSRNGGDWQPSKRETWLDVQARALGQACKLVLHEVRFVLN
tara:strand:+ start:100 stop:456 length:357 start_codon:yes stop_codon:yes gene_type:complete